jgi:hypothetical protein
MSTHIQATRHIQTLLPAEWHRRLRDLSYETRRPLGDLLLDAVVLLLNFHERGAGLPAPITPKNKSYKE